MATSPQDATSRPYLPCAIGIFGGAFLWSFLSSVYGAALPEISTDLSLSAQDGGAIFSLWSVGFMAGGLLTGLLATILSARLLGLAGTAAVACGAGTIALAGSGFALAAGMVLTSVAGGVMLTVISASIGAVAGKSGRSGALGLMDVFFSSGNIAAPLFVTTFIAIGWRGAYWASAAAVAAIAGFVFLAASTGSPEIARRSSAGSMRLLRSFHLWTAILAAFGAAGVEWGMVLWVASFLQGTHDLAPQTAKTGMTLFATGMAASRLSLGVVLRVVAAERVLALTFLGMAAALVGLWSAGGTLVLLGLCLLVGSSCGPAFPLILGRALDRFPERAVPVSGLVIPATGLGAAACSAAVGIVAERFGLETMPAVLLGLAALCLLTLPVLTRRSTPARSPSQPSGSAKVSRHRAR